VAREPGVIGRFSSTKKELFSSVGVLARCFRLSRRYLFTDWARLLGVLAMVKRAALSKSGRDVAPGKNRWNVTTSLFLTVLYKSFRRSRQAGWLAWGARIFLTSSLILCLAVFYETDARGTHSSASPLPSLTPSPPSSSFFALDVSLLLLPS
jgi:hypothetical protein